ncbi:hypothetical protein BC830DRAFT_634822 [Chytriomyces sp. MP71]|nr:hypothetical protein BC830DRAFT_634822 [Chytriomyces sp. MP71]
MTTSCHRHRILDGGGTTPFGQAYFQACMNRQTPVLAQVISPALEMMHQLHIDVDGIKREEDWEPLLKALRHNSDLMEIRMRSNMGPGMQGVLAELVGEGASTSSDGFDEAGSSSSSRNVKLNYATKRALPEALRKKDKVTRGSAQTRMGRVAMKLVGAIKDTLIRSSRITALELAGVHFTQSALNVLQRGLAGNETLIELSLARSNIGDGGLFILIPGIKAAKSLCNINLAACQLTSQGAGFLSDLIKSQAVQRQAAKWVSTLRAHPLDPMREGYVTQDIYAAAVAGPTLEIPLGTPTPIRRLNLCCNLLGDMGLDILLDGLVEEIGMLAVDVQYNDITDAGGRIVEQLVRINGELVIVDLRNNRIDPILLRIITSLLQVNMTRRVRASSVPFKTKNRSIVTWLSESHPLESTYHSTSTTATSSIPYENVRIAMRKANVLNHLRRHTSSSIRKQNFASTKDAEAEIRRKRRKWAEVEAASRNKIPKGNLPLKKSTDPKTSKTKLASNPSIGVSMRIPGPAWTEALSSEPVDFPPYDARGLDVNAELEDISEKLDSLFVASKHRKERKYETVREARLWAENQALKQRLLEAEDEKQQLRPEWVPEQLPADQLDNFPVHAPNISKQSSSTWNTRNGLPLRRNDSRTLNHIFDNYNSTHIPNESAKNAVSYARLNSLRDGQSTISEPGRQQSIYPSSSNAPKPRSPIAILNNLAAELDAFIARPPERTRSSMEDKTEVHTVEFQGVQTTHTDPLIQTIEDAYASFRSSAAQLNTATNDPSAQASSFDVEALTDDILKSYMGTSEAALLAPGESHLRNPTTEIHNVHNMHVLKVVDESLSNFMLLLEEIERSNPQAEENRGRQRERDPDLAL